MPSDGSSLLCQGEWVGPTPRLERDTLVIVAARERAETVQQCSAQPFKDPFSYVLQRRRFLGKFSGKN
jgi:hypothetical protein